jgi:DNA primase large subunit
MDRSTFVDDLQAVLNANPNRPADDKLPVGYVPVREDASSAQFFKVKWTQAMDLVSSRRVFLRAGYAFVPRDKLVSIIINRYRSHVLHHLRFEFPCD